jgi:hypothetical protein
VCDKRKRERKGTRSAKGLTLSDGAETRFSVTVSFSFPPPSSVFLLGLVFDPEDGHDMFLRDVCFSPKCRALQIDRCTDVNMIRLRTESHMPNCELLSQNGKLNRD